MLSVLIPVYNQPVKSLVSQLFHQLDAVSVAFQIIVLDDGSTDEDIKSANRKVSEFIHVSYLEGSENLGRARVRNKLARLAMFENLLFLDADVSIPDKNFIGKYLDLVHHPVVCGGLRYQETRPALEFLSHWRIGRAREAKKAYQRKAYHLFTSNLLIQAGVMSQFPFDETIIGYGYEDLVLAQNLLEKNVPIFHTDNPVIHEGLSTNQQFAEKSRLAIKNLLMLEQAGKFKSTPLLRAANICEQIPGMRSLLSLLQKSLDKSILKGKIKPWMFDLWKLSEVLHQKEMYNKSKN